MFRPTVCAALGAALAVAGAAACHSAPPPAPPPAPIPLSQAEVGAVDWVQTHAVRLTPTDSMPSADERTKLGALAGDARIVGISELTEGTREFPTIVGHLLFSLADASGFRGLAIQAPMPEAMEVDRYVRTGSGDLRRLLRGLGSWRWETPEMVALINQMRDWNRAHPDRQLGFAGFEIPTAAHAVSIVNAMPDSITGAPLKAWFRREYACVLTDEAARFGREGRAADSTFWRRCGTVANAAVDSIVALRQRSTPARAAQLAWTEQMARLVQHHVTTGLRYLSRQDANAEHVLYAANAIAPNAKLLVWGGDVEMGRLKLDSNTVQTGFSLGKQLGARYRAIAFLAGNGTIRTRPATLTRGGQPAGLSTLTLAAPTPEEYENVFTRVSLPAFWLDLRELAGDAPGTWLKGPHPARLITEPYQPLAPKLFETPLEFPQYYDAVVFVKSVSATRG